MKYKVFFFKDLYIDFLSKLLESVVKKEIFGMNFFLEIFYKYLLLFFFKKGFIFQVWLRENFVILFFFGMIMMGF